MPPPIALRDIATDLTSPIGIVSARDGTNRLFIVQQTGQIRILANGVIVQEPFIDLSAATSAGGERGLLGLAFHPNYACDGRFFVNYTDPKGNTIVEAYRVSPSDPDRADPEPLARLLNIDQPFPNHNGGDLAFGPDGLLYIGTGDGGLAGDPFGNGQRLDTELGKLLRIDVDRPQAGRAYGIPSGNCIGCPADPLPEIYAYGLRNPWRFSFDRATGDLWIGDVGQGAYEEIDHIGAGAGSGANFGWNVMEGLHCYPAGSTCARTGLTLPVAEYDHSLGDCSITGGFVYRGSTIPGLQGWYLASDYCTGRIRAVNPAQPGTPAILLEPNRTIASFGEDEQGELYVADSTRGRIAQVVNAN